MKCTLGVLLYYYVAIHLAVVYTGDLTVLVYIYPTFLIRTMTEYVHVQANRISASMMRVVGNDGSVVRDTCVRLVSCPDPLQKNQKGSGHETSVRLTSVYSLFIAVL